MNEMLSPIHDRGGDVILEGYMIKKGNKKGLMLSEPYARYDYQTGATIMLYTMC